MKGSPIALYTHPEIPQAVINSKSYMHTFIHFPEATLPVCSGRITKRSSVYSHRMMELRSLIELTHGEKSEDDSTSKIGH